jgi:hypothetical protein
MESEEEPLLLNVRISDHQSVELELFPSQDVEQQILRFGTKYRLDPQQRAVIAETVREVLGPSVIREQPELESLEFEDLEISSRERINFTQNEIEDVKESPKKGGKNSGSFMGTATFSLGGAKAEPRGSQGIPVPTQKVRDTPPKVETPFPPPSSPSLTYADVFGPQSSESGRGKSKKPGSTQNVPKKVAAQLVQPESTTSIAQTVNSTV